MKILVFDSLSGISFSHPKTGKGHLFQFIQIKCTEKKKSSLIDNIP